MINVTIWNEFRHEKMEGEGGDAVRKCYPEGIHEFLRKTLAPQMEDCVFNTAWLDQDENGLPDEVLNKTDVLVWWGHIAHHDVSDEIVDKVQKRVLGGMGLVVLHSGHLAKVFCRMLGTGCTLRWREIGEKERVWVADPSHPIATGVPDSFVVEQTEMYGEPFDIPNDGHVVFMSWYEGGNVFRSGVTFNRGLGKIFYFSPGHESLPIYHNKDVQKVIVNGIRWAAPVDGVKAAPSCPNEKEPLEKVASQA